jgi:hypothetical protein
MSDTQAVETKARWKVVEIVIGPTKTARFAEGADWEWKKPFQALKKSVIRAENEDHILLRVVEEEKDAIYALCDGRHKVETVWEPEPEPQCESCMKVPVEGVCDCTHVEKQAAETPET